MNTAQQKIVKQTVFTALVAISMVMPVVAANLAGSASGPGQAEAAHTPIHGQSR